MRKLYFIVLITLYYTVSAVTNKELEACSNMGDNKKSYECYSKIYKKHNSNKNIENINNINLASDCQLKAKKVLHLKFSYSPNNLQSFILMEICRRAEKDRANEYDVAIFFMLAQMNLLYGNSPVVISFIRKHSKNIKKIIPYAESKKEDIVDMLSKIKSKHGM